MTTKDKNIFSTMTPPKRQHQYNTDFFCTWAGKTSVRSDPMSWHKFELFSKSKGKVRSLVYFPALTLSQTLRNYTGDDASPLLAFQNTADSTMWKLEEINVGTFGNLYHWTSVCPSSLAKRCPFIRTQRQGEWGVMLRPCTVSLLTTHCIQTEWQ